MGGTSLLLILASIVETDQKWFFWLTGVTESGTVTQQSVSVTELSVTGTVPKVICSDMAETKSECRYVEPCADDFLSAAARRVNLTSGGSTPIDFFGSSSSIS